MNTALRVAGGHHHELKRHLFPGDGLEAVAFGLCGRHETPDRTVLLLREVHLVPYAECERHETSVSWNTDRLEALFNRAAAESLSVVKFHSHPLGGECFSDLDDQSDTKVFDSAFGWIDDVGVHGSVIVLPDGALIGRAIREQRDWRPFERITVVGDDIIISNENDGMGGGQRTRRQEQLFGETTNELLASLTVAVIGVSGTGTPTAEMWARSGVRRLILIDPKRVRVVNLGRMLNTFESDVGRYKVDVLADAIRRMGFGTEVIPIAAEIGTEEAVRAVAGADLVCGCMDGAIGRHILNRLSSYYVLPLMDLGIQLKGDGQGGVDEVYGALNYIQPLGSSLLSRNVYTSEHLRAESLLKSDPAAYKEQLNNNYIVNVDVERPAVIGVNTTLAGLGMMEILARLHPFRAVESKQCAFQGFSFVHQTHYEGTDGESCPVMARHVGKGDQRPLLGLPEIVRSKIRKEEAA